MTIKTIDAAILAHQTWVARFQTSLKGINNESFDISLARDHGACLLGGWLKSERSRELLDAESHVQIVAIHAIFHEIAGDIAEKLNNHESGKDMEDWLAEFARLSSQLVMLLIHVKRRA